MFYLRILIQVWIQNQIQIRLRNQVRGNSEAIQREKGRNMFHSLIDEASRTGTAKNMDPVARKVDLNSLMMIVS